MLIALYVLLIGSVWCWQPHVLPWQTVWQLLSAALLGLMLYRQLKKPQPIGAVNLSEDGKWQWLDGQSSPMQVTTDSRVTAWLLFVSLQDALDHRQRQYLCIFRDAVSVADYRRLCRILSLGHPSSLEGN